MTYMADAKAEGRKKFNPERTHEEHLARFLELHTQLKAAPRKGVGASLARWAMMGEQEAIQEHLQTWLWVDRDGLLTQRPFGYQYEPVAS